MTATAQEHLFNAFNSVSKLTYGDKEKSAAKWFESKMKCHLHAMNYQPHMLYNAQL